LLNKLYYKTKEENKCLDTLSITATTTATTIIKTVATIAQTVMTNIADFMEKTAQTSTITARLATKSVNTAALRKFLALANARKSLTKNAVASTERTKDLAKSRTTAAKGLAGNTTTSATTKIRIVLE